MIDEAFVHRLQELRHSGEREAFKTEFTLNGGWDRILDLAEIGATNTVKKRKLRTVASKEEPEGFSEFYAAFPHHVARGTAASAYGRALKVTTVDFLLAAAKRYATECSETEKRFIKHPATWLNGKCWADEDLIRAAPKLRVVGGNWDINQEG